MKKIRRLQGNRVLYDYGLLSFGVFLTALAIVYLFTPNKLAAGGAQGIALVINYYTNLNIGLTMVMINLTLFTAAFFMKRIWSKNLVLLSGIIPNGFYLRKILLQCPVNDKPHVSRYFWQCSHGGGGRNYP